LTTIYYNEEQNFNCDIEIFDDLVEIIIDYYGKKLSEYYTIEEYNDMVNSKQIILGNTANAQF
jgi:hypothetical protein